MFLEVEKMMTKKLLQSDIEKKYKCSYAGIGVFSHLAWFQRGTHVLGIAFVSMDWTGKKYTENRQRVFTVAAGPGARPGDIAKVLHIE
jgi:hypothetical protein